MTNLTFLKYFYDAATNKSVQQAAKLNFVTPASVSAGIKKLEELYQVKLLEHKKKQFELTQKGKQFLKELPTLFDAIETFEQSILEGEDLSGEIKLATTHSLAISILPPILSKLNKLHPEISVTIQIAKPEEIKQLLHEKSIHLGFSIERDPIRDLKKIDFHRGKFYVVKTKQCKSEMIAVTKKWPEVLQFEHNYYKENKENCPIAFRAPSWSIVKEFVEKGIYQGLLPDYLISPKLTRTHRKIPQDHYKIVLLYKEELRTIDEAFLSLIKQK